MDVEAAKLGLQAELRTALLWLYDPGVLRRSPLVAYLGADEQRDPVGGLRNMLLEAIESFRPQGATPLASKTWRVYQVLHRRYTEQVPQRQVASDLGLSLRQLQREERLAREMLADFMWDRFKLGSKAPLRPATGGEDLSDTDMPSRDQEMAWLSRSVPAQMVDLATTVREVAETLKPVLASLQTTLEWDLPINLPRTLAQLSLVRQALLNMLTASAQIAEGGSVLIHLWASAEQIHIAMQSQPPAVTPASRPADEPEILELTRELLEAAGGSLVIISGDGSHTLELALPLSAPREFSVLVVDDNADALQLYQRYLSGSRYRCHTLQKAEETLAVAAALRPSLILLDVMMPETDGWTLLHDLREQAGTQAIPIIVCSILPHQKLALALGAAEFLRKPVTRSALLAAMERQLSPGLTEAG